MHEFRFLFANSNFHGPSECVGSWRVSTLSGDTDDDGLTDWDEAGRLLHGISPSIGEWLCRNLHDTAPYVDEPACWIGGITPTVRARLAVRPADITNAVLYADHAGTILSDIPDAAVAFDGGITLALPPAPHLPNFCPFPLANAVTPMVSRSTNEVWSWRAEAVNGHPVGGCLVTTNGPSVAYSILGAPVEQCSGNERQRQILKSSILSPTSLYRHHHNPHKDNTPHQTQSYIRITRYPVATWASAPRMAGTIHDFLPKRTFPPRHLNRLFIY